MFFAANKAQRSEPLRRETCGLPSRVVVRRPCDREADCRSRFLQEYGGAEAQECHVANDIGDRGEYDSTGQRWIDIHALQH